MPFFLVLKNVLHYTLKNHRCMSQCHLSLRIALNFSLCIALTLQQPERVIYDALPYHVGHIYLEFSAMLLCWLLD